MLLVIGSTALKQLLPIEEPKDVDFLCTIGDFNSFRESVKEKIVLEKETIKGERRLILLLVSGHKPLEFEIISEKDYDFLNGHCSLDVWKGREVLFADTYLLYALKMSHRYLKNSPHFLKTMKDIKFLRSWNIDHVPDYLEPWYKERIKKTYYYNHPKLDQSKENFFKDDAIPYLYDHDTLHEAVKMDERPAFEYIKKDAAQVFCSKEKFNEAPPWVKLNTVLEESLVLALERHQIPNDFKPSPGASFRIALEKVCTSIASGWWREFAWEHYDEVLALYSSRGTDYCQRFKEDLNNGVIKPYHAG